MRQLETNIWKAYRLAMAIIRVKVGCVTEEEQKLLLEWLDESEANRQTYKRIVRGEVIREHLIVQSFVVETTDYEKLIKQIIRQIIRRRRVREIVVWSSVVAVLCIGIGMSLWWREQKNSSLEQIGVVAVNKVDTKVKLVLSSGEEIDLMANGPGTVRLEEGVAENRGGRLVYVPIGKRVEKEILNRVLTTVGGEYMLQLSDGTKVWLNAVSELEFPLRFIGDERVVRLSGEAYFEVARDEAHPFVVEVEGMRTRVLGTSFNIQAYGNEQSVHTTLLSGKVQVEVEGSGETVILEPGMQAVWERKRQDIYKREVNVENAIAWRYGNFVFVEEDIEMIMRMLERWYDVEFVFEGSKQEKHTFNGSISRYDSLMAVLDMITFTGGPAFRQEGKVIYVIEK